MNIVSYIEDSTPQESLTPEALVLYIAIPTHIRITPCGGASRLRIETRNTSTRASMLVDMDCHHQERNSARQVTFGPFQDTQVEWAPDGRVGFLSDRHHPGKLSAIF